MNVYKTVAWILSGGGVVSSCAVPVIGLCNLGLSILRVLMDRDIRGLVYHGSVGCLEAGQRVMKCLKKCLAVGHP